MTAESLGHRLAALAAAAPDRPAVIAADVRTGGAETITWSVLDERTALLAGALARSVEPGTPVWLPVPATVDGAVALLAALRSGLLAVPVDAGAPVAARERQLAAVAAGYGVPVALSDVDAGGPPLPPDPRPRGGWLLLTGGTTGVPKAVRGAAPAWDPERGAPLLLQHAGWRPGQVQLVLGPLHHAAPFASFLDGVLSGNTVVVANGYYPELIFELVAAHGVEWAQLTPVHMRMAQPLLGRYPLTGLRAVLHTAAPCPADTKRAWLSALGPERVFEMYAATEGIGTTLCSGTQWLARPGTVGRGFLTRIRITGPDGRELPTGQVGEVWMRGARRLPGGGAGGFRSVGDHGRVDADGYLYLSGRADDLVIIGGENVYLGAVEAALLRLDGVADAAVVSAADEVYGVSLHAYVVPRPGHALDAAGLHRHCRRELPAYQLPRTFELVAELPRNAAGKLRRGDPAFARPDDPERLPA